MRRGSLLVVPESWLGRRVHAALVTIAVCAALLLFGAVALASPGRVGDSSASLPRVVTTPLVYESVAAATTPASETRSSAFRVYDDPRELSRSRTAAEQPRLAAKGADEAVEVGTDLTVRPKLKPSRHYLHERKMERQLRTADVFDAYKNHLAVGPARYDAFGRPSMLFQGRNAQVAVNPQTGEIVTAFPTGSRLRRQLLRRAGGSP